MINPFMLLFKIVRGIAVGVFAFIGYVAYCLSETAEDRRQDYIDEYGEDEGLRRYRLEGGRL